MTDLLWQRAGKGAPVLLLAHGAGAPMDSTFMQMLTEALCAQGISVARFEFSYMAQRRHSGSKRPPESMPRLLDAFAQAADRAGGLDNIFIGGKSLGGRVATMLAAQQGCRGVVCFGYPFHPPGKLEKTRIAHLLELEVPVLICQGERDPFGCYPEVSTYPLSSKVSIHWCADGNHDLAPRKTSGTTQQENLAQAVQAVRNWVTATSLK